MNLSAQLANGIRQVHFGGNWTSVNLRDTLRDVDREMALKKIHSLNTILALVYHINYYVDAVSGVLDGKPLSSKDQFSFDHPLIESEEDWQQMLNKLWSDAEKFASQIEALPESKLWESFVEEKYGTCYRNFSGIIEHTHYHLGQIVLIKKLITVQS